MPEAFEPRYPFAEIEPELYRAWEKSGYFGPEACLKDGITNEKSEAFSIVLPPPNVTGTLHMGHAAMLAIEDIMVRRARMQGKRTVWIPGTDHAAIATQAKVEAELYKKEKKTRHDLGRDEFLARVEDFAAASRTTITSQVKAMGASLDWGREAYTLDEARTLAVRTAFERMYREGLIYRGARLVNWDPKLQTTVSDDEIEWVEETVPFYYFQYGPFVIGTSRPETKFGDKYVVMHPDDERYAAYAHGSTITLEWINGPVTATIIKDPVIDKDFGTGVMTITPWHDAADFDIAERHHLDKEQIIDSYGKLLPIAGEFAGLHIKKARPLLVEKLKEKGLLVKVDEKYIHRVATNSRGGGTIEPQIKEQWFIDVNKEFVPPVSKIAGVPAGKPTTLKALMLAAVREKQIMIRPERFEKIYYHWIENLRDWCISRQIWYGHRIPVWYREQEIYCGVEAPEGAGWQQDPDTLDTWFSSGLWTFSTLGWPNNTKDLGLYHPTSVLETGYDIIFFWVARMILMTGYLLGDIPFRNVYLHGLVRDEKGRKMSKSIGNTIDPLEMVTKYGADATRLSLVIGAAVGNDIKLSENRVRGYRNFATKIWNAARFVYLNRPTGTAQAGPATPADEEALRDLRTVIAKTNENLDAFEFHRAAEDLYHYFWHTFADKIIEAAKPRLQGADQEDRARAYLTLEEILRTSLVLLHPFVPFVTEAVYQKFFPGRPLMIERWPTA